MIDDNKVTRIQKRIRQAIAEIQKEENVVITFGTCRYDAAHYRTTMTVKSTEKNKREVFKADEATCKRLGLPANVIGMEFTNNRSRMKVTEIRTRNRKYPVICENLKTGKFYKYTVNQINNFLGEASKRNSKLKDILDDYS